MEKRLTWCIYGNAILLAAVAFYFFFYPAMVILRDLNDPGLKNGDTPPRFAYTWHRSLSPKFAKWAWERVASGQAAGMSVQDISGTRNSHKYIHTNRWNSHLKEIAVFSEIFYSQSFERNTKFK